MNEMKRPSLLLKSAYAMGNVGSCFVWVVAASFLTLYYTDCVGVSPAFIGTMMLIVRLFDGVSDIVMGTIIEKTHTRYGKARPWLMIGGVPLAVSLVLVFGMPTGFSAMEKNIYAFVTYFFMAVICYTMVNLSYFAILPNFSPDPQDRTIITTLTNILGCIQAIAIASVTPKLLAFFGGTDNQAAWTKTMVIYAILAIICLFICFFFVKEKGTELVTDKNKVDKVPITKALKALFKTKYFYLGIIIMVFEYIYGGCFGGGAVYYAKDVLGDMDKFTALNMAQNIPLLLPLAPFLIKKFGRKRAVTVGLAGCVLCGIVNLFFTTSASVTVACVFIRGLAMIPMGAVLFTLASDVVEYVEWKNGFRLEGLITSINSFGMKVGTGVGSAILGWVLAFSGYNANSAVQTESAAMGIIGVTIIIPTICFFVVFLAMMCWDIDKYRPEIDAKKRLELNNDDQ